MFASTCCFKALGTTLIASSRSIGWQALLLDQDMIEKPFSEFETMVTADITLVAMLSGQQNIEVRKGARWHSASYCAGTIGLTPSGHANRIRRTIAANDRPKKAVLYLPVCHLTQAAEHYRRAGHSNPSSDLNALAFQDQAISGTVNALLRAVRAGEDDLYAQVAAQWLAVHLLARHAGWRSIEDDQRSPGVIHDQRLRRVIDYMAENFALPLTLDVLASEAGVSRYHFIRLFKSRVGVTPLAHLARLRLEHARGLLKSTDLRIADIAFQCGFGSSNYFSALYAHTFGERPTDTRRVAFRPVFPA